MSSSLSSKEQYYQYIREKQALLEEVQRLRRQVNDAQVAIQRSAGGSEQLITQNINLACRNFVSIFNLKLTLVKSRAFGKWIALSFFHKGKVITKSTVDDKNNIRVKANMECNKGHTYNEGKVLDSSFTSTRSAFTTYRNNNKFLAESSVKTLKNQGESKAILIDDLPFFKKATSRKAEIAKDHGENGKCSIGNSNNNKQNDNEEDDDVLLGLSELLQDATAEEREIFMRFKSMYSSKQKNRQQLSQQPPQPYYLQEDRGRSVTRAVPTRVLTAPLTPNSMSHVRRLTSSSASPTLTVRSSRSTSSYVSRWGKDSWRTDCDSVSVRKQRLISGESSLLRDTQKSFARRRALSADRKPVSPPRPALTGSYRHLDKRQQALLRGDFEDEHHGINHKQYWSQLRSLASSAKRFVT